MSAETISLSALVHHSEHIPHDLSMEEAERHFRNHDLGFLALIRDGRVMGLCCRNKLTGFLGTRFGFSLHSRSPAHMSQVDRPLVYEADTPIRRVLQESMGREGASFLEDVVVVDVQHRLIGLIPTERLAQLQNELVSEQVSEIRRQNEDLLRYHRDLGRARALWMGLFEGGLVGVALLTPDGRIEAMNRRCSSLLRLDESLERGGAYFLDDFAPKGMACSLMPATGVIAPMSFESTLQVKGGGERNFRLSFAWIPESGQYCLCLDDITEQKALEQRMKQREKQVLFDTLVAGIAHELNNKITPVIGFAELLESAVSDETSRSFLHCIRKSTSEAAAIIRQLLQLSRPETGNRTEVDLREIVSEALLMLKFHMQQGKLRVTADLCQEPAMVQADAGMIKQVIMNLAINAIHATETAAEPRIQFLVQRQPGGGGQLQVKDNGIGISREVMGRIFDPFFTTKAPDKGSGLGLSVCLSIARQHGGTLSAVSEPGMGACFSLTLPGAGSQLGGQRRQDDPVLPVAEVFDRELRAEQNRSERLRVLVVDDEETVRQLMKEILLRGKNCRVDIASNAEMALAMITRSSFDLVISDVRMPGMNGVDFYRELVKVRHEYSRKFLLTTGYAGDGEVEQLIHRLGVPILRKPFTAEILLRACTDRLKNAVCAA